MLYREIIAVCSQIHTKHINTLCGQKVELLNVTTGRIGSECLVLPLFSKLYMAIKCSYIYEV